jgi:hypothetical protein
LNAPRCVARAVCLTCLVVTVVVAPTPSVSGEPSIGATGGATLSGDQDVKITQPHIGSTESKDVVAAPGPVGGATGSLWFSHFGLQVDGIYWRTSTPGVLPGSLKKVRVGQDRGALLGSVLGRVFLDQSGDTFAYGGVGSGFVAIGVHPGQTNVVPGFGTLLGVAFPITSHLRLRAEARYLVTHDNIDPRNARSLSTEVSGSRGPNPGRAVFGPHFDTEFVPLLIGLDYVFRP